MRSVGNNSKTVTGVTSSISSYPDTSITLLSNATAAEAIDSAVYGINEAIDALDCSIFDCKITTGSRSLY